jgi:FeS assembly protein IscX
VLTHEQRANTVPFNTICIDLNGRSLERDEDTMAAELTWDDVDKIGVALSKEHPGVDPDNAALQEVHRLTTQLKQFTGDPRNYNESKLETIRTAWNMEFLERTQ